MGNVIHNTSFSLWEVKQSERVESMPSRPLTCKLNIQFLSSNRNNLPNDVASTLRIILHRHQSALSSRHTNQKELLC